MRRWLSTVAMLPCLACALSACSDAGPGDSSPVDIAGTGSSGGNPSATAQGLAFDITQDSDSSIVWVEPTLYLGSALLFDQNERGQGCPMNDWATVEFHDGLPFDESQWLSLAFQDYCALGLMPGREDTTLLELSFSTDDDPEMLYAFVLRTDTALRLRIEVDAVAAAPAPVRLVWSIDTEGLLSALGLAADAAPDDIREFMDRQGLELDASDAIIDASEILIDPTPTDLEFTDEDRENSARAASLSFFGRNILR